MTSLYDLSTDYSKDMEQCYTLARKHGFQIAKANVLDANARYMKPKIGRLYLNTFLWCLEELCLEGTHGGIPHTDANSSHPLERSNGEYLLKHWPEYCDGAYITEPTLLRRHCRLGVPHAIDFAEAVKSLQDDIVLDEEGMSRLEWGIISKAIDEEWEDAQRDIHGIDPTHIPYHNWEAEFRQSLAECCEMEGDGCYFSTSGLSAARDTLYAHVEHWYDDIKDAVLQNLAGTDGPFNLLSPHTNVRDIADALCPEGGSIMGALAVEDALKSARGVL